MQVSICNAKDAVKVEITKLLYLRAVSSIYALKCTSMLAFVSYCRNYINYPRRDVRGRCCFRARPYSPSFAGTLCFDIAGNAITFTEIARNDGQV
jgi:hypothetical protein